MAITNNATITTFWGNDAATLSAYATDGFAWKGKLDKVRIANVAHSTDWLTANTNLPQTVVPETPDSAVAGVNYAGLASTADFPVGSTTVKIEIMRKSLEINSEF